MSGMCRHAPFCLTCTPPSSKMLLWLENAIHGTFAGARAEVWAIRHNIPNTGVPDVFLSAVVSSHQRTVVRGINFLPEGVSENDI